MFTYNLFRSKFSSSASHKKLKTYQNTPYFVGRPTNWIMGLGYIVDVVMQDFYTYIMNFYITCNE